ncbi:MAG: serine protease [Syntrophomonas sp.]|nr:serine protease [Syntrophomonas sp.]
MFERLAKATVKIECGKSSGSGFHFIDKQIIVTNHHVIEGHLLHQFPVVAITEDRKVFRLQLITYSDKNHYDYAILKSLDDVPEDREILHPKMQDYLKRGTNICFSGFPHGINDLLVHKASVSGPAADNGFYIDGSVNGGNSGGPIVDTEDFCIVGIVTQRRFLGANQLQLISSRANELQKQCQNMSGKGGVHIMGIDFAQFANLMGESFSLSSSIIEANANAGIGIGYHIKFVNQKFTEVTHE